jgi:hypothetical protein
LAAKVGIAKIVGQHDDNVGLPGRVFSRDRKATAESEEKGEEMFHEATYSLFLSFFLLGFAPVSGSSLFPASAPQSGVTFDWFHCAHCD